MRLGGALLLLLSAAMCPLLPEGATCQAAPEPGRARGRCPLNLTSVQAPGTMSSYNVKVSALMSADDLCHSAKIEIRWKETETLWPILKGRRCQTPVNCKRCRGAFESRVRCRRDARTDGSELWELKHEVSGVPAGDSVSVHYSGKSTNCSVTDTVPDPVPDFQLSVNHSSRSISVAVETGQKVFARWCYKNGGNCDGSKSPQITIDPSVSRFATFSLPHLLPCICVQVYYTFPDAKRHLRCPLRNASVPDLQDVWRASEVTSFPSKLEWSFVCPTDGLNISGALCWSQDGLCTLAVDSKLERLRGPPLEFNTSTVDVHPHMCVQFSLDGSHVTHCPFTSEAPSWEVDVGPGRRSLVAHVTSSVPAKFSAQLCVLSEGGCSPTGSVYSVTAKKRASSWSMNVPVHAFTPTLCVQVWRSDPALQGRRIICPDFVHGRRGVYVAAALMFAVGAVLLGVLIRGVAKRGAAGWLYFHRPLLLVCSSDRAAHVSAVCALASILHEELGAPVHVSLWAQSSRGGEGGGGGGGVADLGPLPWLYGQWDAVSEARGKVLIVWSAEAKSTFQKWREERGNPEEDEKKKKRKKDDQRKECRRHERTKQEVSGKRRMENGAEKSSRTSRGEPSAAIEPVFMAAMACLEAALRRCEGHLAAIVYFQGGASSRDVPKALRGLARYCLPQDFRGLIQELGGATLRTAAGKLRWRCWPRLLSKVLSMWLARQLARRLRAALPRTPPARTASDKSGGGLGLHPELEPLDGSPWRDAERLQARVSPGELLFCGEHEPHGELLRAPQS